MFSTECRTLGYGTGDGGLYWFAEEGVLVDDVVIDRNEGTGVTIEAETCRLVEIRLDDHIADVSLPPLEVLLGATTRFGIDEDEVTVSIGIFEG